jgi:hypothetical protein
VADTLRSSIVVLRPFQSPLPDRSCGLSVRRARPPLAFEPAPIATHNAISTGFCGSDLFMRRARPSLSVSRLSGTTRNPPDSAAEPTSCAWG